MPTSIYDLVKQKYGNQIILHALRSGADSAPSLDVNVKDGYYRIVQHNNSSGNPPYDASVINPTAPGQTTLKVKMDNSTNILNRVVSSPLRIERVVGV